MEDRPEAGQGRCISNWRPECMAHAEQRGRGGQNKPVVVCVVPSLTLTAFPFAWRGLLQRAVPWIFVTMTGPTPLA